MKKAVGQSVVDSAEPYKSRQKAVEGQKISMNKSHMSQQAHRHSRAGG